MPVAETRLASISGSRWLLSTLSPAEHVRFDCASTKHPAWADMPMNCDVTVGPNPVTIGDDVTVIMPTRQPLQSLLSLGGHGPVMMLTAPRRACNFLPVVST